jgi:serine phosphatase RsbU (regulator of sigma subunit)
MSWGQTRKIDSLQNVLTQNISDSTKVNVFNQLSFALRNNDIKKALQYAKDANSLARKINYKNGLAESYGYMGLLYYREGEHALSVESHLKSLRLYEQLGNKRFIAFRYNDLGNVYVEQEFYDKARAYFNLSLAIKDEIKDEDGVVTTMKNIANLYIHQRNYSKALEISLRTLPKAERLKNERNISDLLGFIAESYLHQDSLDKAMQYYDKVYALRIKQNDEYTLPRVLNGIARVHHKRKNLDKALKIYEEAIDIAKKNNIKVAIRRAYEYMSELYEQKNDYVNAFKYEKLANTYRDSLYNQKSNDKIAVSQAIFDDEKEQVERTKQQELKDTQIKRREDVILASSIVAILLAVLTLLLWKNNQEKAKNNKLLMEQKQEIENQNRNTKASILYAQRIQQAILPQEKDYLDYFKDSFLLYKPKDIVSGDFHWVYAINNPKSMYYGQIIVAVADCTGHGVPGGFMSMIGNDLLDKIIIEREIYEPGAILEVLNISLNDVLNKEKTSNMDGMEIAICRVSPHERKISYAGSMISLFVWDGELQEYKADKYYLGGKHRDWIEIPEFQTQEIQIKSSESMLYMATDGFQDQLGGEKYKKLSSKRFKGLLEQIQNVEVSEQKKQLDQYFEAWQLRYPQTDDVLVLGLKI